MSGAPVEPGYAVIAVDGSEDGYAAVAFGAQEARRRGLALRLAHVMPAWVPLGPLVMLAAEHEGGAFASETLASAARLATDLAPEVEVTTHLLLGGRVSNVVDLAAQARLVVVGRRPTGALDRAWSGGTLDGIVSRARCPVIMAPRTDARGDRPERVVAGFKSANQSDELFEAAFSSAQELGAELEVLHAWKLSGGYDDIIARRVSEASSNRDQKDPIWRLLSPWQESYPDVHVRVHVLHEHPVRALVDASREADRLVLVKPLHGRVVHHLGRTARGVLRFAECAVEVVPAKPRDDLTMPTLDIERKGELVP